MQYQDRDSLYCNIGITFIYLSSNVSRLLTVLYGVEFELMMYTMHRMQTGDGRGVD